MQRDEKSYMAYQRELIRPFIEATDSLPYGQRIPSTWQPPEGFSYEKIDLDGPIVECLIPKERKTEKVMFHLHGGAYALSLLDPYREASVEYSNIAGGAVVINVDYRTAPTDVYPTALEDCVKAYKWALEQGYKSENMIFVGDSAGGNLVLAVTLYLRDHEMPLPKAIIAISPWADLAFDLPSRENNIDKDVVIGNNASRILEEAKKPSYLGKGDIKNPYISPVNGDYTGFPPLLIQNGSHEILLDDGIIVYEKAKQVGVQVKQTIYEGMSHDFQLLLPTLEESKAAWDEMSQFVKEIMA